MTGTLAIANRSLTSRRSIMVELNAVKGMHLPDDIPVISILAGIPTHDAIGRALKSPGRAAFQRCLASGFERLASKTAGDHPFRGSSWFGAIPSTRAPASTTLQG